MIPINLPQRAYIKAMWRLDETGGNRADTSGNNHIATDINTVLYDIGKIGNAALFVAAQQECFSVVDHADLKPTTPFSIACWIKTTDYYGIFQSFALASSKVAGIQLIVNGNGKVVLMSGKNTGIVDGTDFKTVVSSTAVTTGSLVHVGGTWNGTHLRIYVAGLSDATAVAWANAPAYQATNYVRIGCKNNTGTNLEWFNGLIDELIFWNGVALSDAEMLQVKNILNYSYGGFLPFFM